MNTNILNVSFWQTSPPKKSILLYVKKFSKELRRVKFKSNTLVIFPEIFLGGPQNQTQRGITAKIYTEVMQDLQALSNQNSVHFCGSYLEKNGPRYYNTAFFISPHQKIKKYAKMNLFSFGGEQLLFSAGQHPPSSFISPWGKMGQIVCYDLRFPELTRKLAIEGARLILVHAQWPHARQKHWLTLLQARAIENQVFIIACNRLGKKGKETFSGDSCVISPWGEILFRVLKKKLCSTKVDLTLVTSIRNRYPFFRDAVTCSRRIHLQK